MARFRATTGTTESRVQAEGKRTGVVIQSQDIPMGADGLEDEDAFFAGTASPLNNKENPRPSKKMARFSLDPNQVARSSSSSKPQDHPDAASGPARLLSKLKQGGDRSWSPSELSRVSTAPPSVESSKLRAARETVRTALASPASVDEMEESVIPPSMAEDDDTHFLATQDDDEEDDLMPPEPPQSPEDEDEESQRMLTQEADDDMMPTQMDSFEEDEDDGPGHTMASGKTPQSAKMLRKKSKKTKESKKRKKVQVVESSDDESKKPATKKASRPKKSKYASIFSPKGIPLPLEYETVPVTDLKSTPPEGVRRSKRARTEPLAFWKNEKAEYGPNDDEDANADVALMPVVKAFIKAKATPYKPRVFRPRPVSTDKTKASWVPDEGAAAAAVLPFDSRKLRKKHDFVEGQSAVLWNEHVDEAEELKVVSYNSEVQPRKLPLKNPRSKAEGNIVGLAAQAFNVPEGPKPEYVGYIMGNLTLPPKGIKDAESVGSCAQTFTVVNGQPGAIEVAYADPDEVEEGVLKPESAIRFLLGPGDMFRVPPGNCYRLHNHSKTTDCFMTWTIIRPALHPGAEDA